MTFNSLLLKEKIINIKSLKMSRLKGFLRVIKEDKGTLGFFLDKKVFAELLELVQYNHPKFWEEIAESRKSGEIPAKRIEKELGIK